MAGSHLCFPPGTKNEINRVEISDLNIQGKTEVRSILKVLAKDGPIGCLRPTAGYVPEVRSGEDVGDHAEYICNGAVRKLPKY